MEGRARHNGDTTTATMLLQGSGSIVALCVAFLMRQALLQIRDRRAQGPPKTRQLPTPEED